MKNPVNRIISVKTVNQMTIMHDVRNFFKTMNSFYVSKLRSWIGKIRPKVSDSDVPYPLAETKSDTEFFLASWRSFSKFTAWNSPDGLDPFRTASPLPACSLWFSKWRRTQSGRSGRRRVPQNLWKISFNIHILYLRFTYSGWI